MKYLKVKIKETYQHTHLCDNLYKPDDELLVVEFDESSFRSLHSQYAHYTKSQRFESNTLDWIDKEYCEILEELSVEDYMKNKESESNG